MREIRWEVVPKPEPGTATIYEKSEQIEDHPILLDMEKKKMRIGDLCDNCGHILANNLGDNVVIQDIIFQCHGCDSYNKIPSYESFFILIGLSIVTPNSPVLFSKSYSYQKSQRSAYHRRI